MSLIAELKRRNVFKVGAAYLALAWMVVQATGAIVPALNLPATLVPTVVWIGIIGFPCVLIVSWVYELTPEGLKRESEIDRSQSITHLTGRRLDYAILVLLVLAIGMAALQYFRPPAAPAAATSEATVTPTVPSAEVVAQAPSVPALEPAAVAPDDKSIAVLPFADMSQAKDQEYLADGMAEELLNLLAQIPELKVIARTSSFYFKGKDLPIAEIARQLNVAHVLEGSVRKAGNTVRITAQLVRTADSTHLWSETYDRPLDDIFAVQDEIASAVVGQLKLTLLGVAPSMNQTDPALYAKLLQSRQLRLQGSVSSQHDAVDILQELLSEKPGYADAWVELAAVYEEKAGNGSIRIDQGYALARDAAQRALKIDSKLASAHALLGDIAWNHDGNAAEAAVHIERALALEPGNPDALGIAANFLLGMGRLDAALELAIHRRDRDPVNQGAHAWLGTIRLYRGDYDDALEAGRTAIRLSPTAVSNRYFVGVTLLLKGDAQAALDEMNQEPDESWRLFGRAMALHALGKKAESDAALDETIRKYAQDSSYNIAYMLAYRGEADRAFEWLGAAVAQRDPGLSELAHDPLFENIRNDPRWLPFLRKLGKAPEQLAAIKFDVKVPQQ